MDIDIDNAVVDMEEKTQPEARVLQSQGRVDIPDVMIDALGLDEGDKVMVSYNKEEDKVEIVDRERVLDEGL
jgi:bifunctional DNA-binding transcriptional regulator/antitoxin component of YhaV-PrlF toxin-antitoxin module